MSVGRRWIVGCTVCSSERERERNILFLTSGDSSLFGALSEPLCNPK